MPGPAPKDPSRATGHRKHPPFKLVQGEPAPQPRLPTIAGLKWPQETVKWWKMWKGSPLAADFADVDWSELLVAARLHAALWTPTTAPNVQLRAAAEPRNRVAKFGATPLDRQRLRITFAVAQIEEDKADAAKNRAKGARARRGPHLSAVEDAK